MGVRFPPGALVYEAGDWVKGRWYNLQMSEGIPAPKPQKTVFEKAAKGARAATAAVAFLGTVGATEVPFTASSGFKNTAEAEELFSAEREAQAFLERVSSMEVGIDDARGRAALRRRVEQEFSMFALACAQRSPHYSAESSTTLRGAITPDVRESARKYLLSRLSQHPRGESEAIEILREFLTGGEVRPALGTEPSLSIDDSDGQKSRVRKYKGQW